VDIDTEITTQYRHLFCALISQAIEDALFLRRVGSLDDKLQVTGKLPNIYRHSQWPKDQFDVWELAEFFKDGRLNRLLAMSGIKIPARRFVEAACSLPVDTQLRQRLAQPTKNTPNENEST